MGVLSPPATDESPSSAVVEAVADEMDAAPTDLRPLYEVVDTEALDALFHDQATTEGTVSFDYCGYEVTVTATGDVTVAE